MLRVPGHDLAPGSRADLVVLDAPGADHLSALLDRVPRRYVISAGALVAETVTTATLHGIRTATMMEA